MEEALEDQTIVKGKRTKRQRPQSPVSVSVLAHSSISAGNNTESPPASSSEFHNTTSPETATVTAATEEEEDLANCLILLAQGNARENPLPEPELGFKFRSKRFVETPAGTGGFQGKAGIYVYQCKTCDRTFPSFQALGGHRASHKRTEDKASIRPRPLTIMSSDEDSDDQLKFKNHKALLGNTNNNSPKFSGGFKIHECSICGAEFMSGQALGGHMRRHRPIPVGANTTLSLSQLAPTRFDSDDQLRETKRQKIAETVSLDLDLNLAPAQASTQEHHRNDDHKQNKSHLVLAGAPALVDCHY